MIFSCHFPWRREDGRMKIVNRPEIHVPQTNHVMDNMGVTVYKFALGLFGLQIDFIGLLQRMDYCGPSIGFRIISCSECTTETYAIKILMKNIQKAKFF